FIYDPIANVDVVARVQDRLSTLSNLRALVTFSTTSQQPAADPPPSGYCKSPYGFGQGDSALMVRPSALYDALQVLLFGQPPYVEYRTGISNCLLPGHVGVLYGGSTNMISAPRDGT